MYIVKDRDRILNIAITALLFLIIFSLALTNSPIMMTFDTLIQDFVLGLSFNHPFLNHLLSFLGHPVMTGLYLIILWFLLWGFKHKLISFWAICTYISGEILFLIIRKIVARELPSGHPQNISAGSFPSHHVFSLILIFMLIYICAMPFLKKRWHVWLALVCMWLIIFILAIARIQLHANYPFDTIAGILLAYSWVEIWEIVYLSFFGNLTRIQVFRHSDFN
ncbi:phosphatase [Paucilactobacillus hokkaidonensis JCM 18461]|uniref:Phosphatase n=2 Tax=Paucilactobacillus hokkaidonensis TaxID=1193095 RepID=A0A0A1GZR5_9LACO|nr:phosphatase PAP2 family protein [Paucilactobacillus hokkaidonensis]KRO11148.1 phosphatase [Paucilactobacillus hokkaidonensis]BAP86489.1 phosphatase [Paucilactobacillus hokkaidonensis JCM 18461]